MPEIDVRFRDGCTRKVEALTFGGWALIDCRHEPNLGRGYRWNITHIPTGSRVGCAKTKKEGALFCCALQRMRARWPTARKRPDVIGSLRGFDRLSRFQIYRIRKKAFALRINIHP